MPQLPSVSPSAAGIVSTNVMKLDISPYAVTAAMCTACLVAFLGILNLTDDGLLYVLSDFGSAAILAAM